MMVATAVVCRCCRNAHAMETIECDRHRKKKHLPNSILINFEAADAAAWFFRYSLFDISQ